MTNLPIDTLTGPGHPGFDAAVRLARRVLAERIAAKTREEPSSTSVGAVIETPLVIAPLQPASDAT